MKKYQAFHNFKIVLSGSSKSDQKQSVIYAALFNAISISATIVLALATFCAVNVCIPSLVCALRVKFQKSTTLRLPPAELPVAIAFCSSFSFSITTRWESECVVGGGVIVCVCERERERESKSETHLE